MARRLLTRLVTALRFPEAEAVHYHTAAGGLPAACSDPECIRPRLSRY
jgi:hypothetical protein